jgi:hypothetical protein
MSDRLARSATQGHVTLVKPDRDCPRKDDQQLEILISVLEIWY